MFRGWVTSTQVARGQLARGLLSGKKSQEGQEPREQVLCSEDFYSWWDGGEEVTYQLVGNGGASFPGGPWLPKHRYGGLLSRILILLQVLFVHFIYVTWGRQLIKVVLWAFLWALWTPPLLPSYLWDEHTVSRFFFSQLVEMIQIFKGSPFLHYHSLLVVQNAWQSYWTGLRITGSGGETCLPLLLASLLVNSLLDCSGEGLAFISPRPLILL